MMPHEYMSAATPRQETSKNFLRDSADWQELDLTTVDGEWKLSKRSRELMRLANLMCMSQTISRRPGSPIIYNATTGLAPHAVLRLTLERGVVRAALTYAPSLLPSVMPRLRLPFEVRRIVRAHSAAPEQKFRLSGDDFNGGLIAVLSRHVDVSDGVLRVDFTSGRYRAVLWLTASEAHICVAPCPLLDRPPEGPLFPERAA